ncbi:MAG TPA: hypothetical protein VF533_19530, partial [Solirubrobacteraceae bacterium]
MCANTLKKLKSPRTASDGARIRPPLPHAWTSFRVRFAVVAVSLVAGLGVLGAVALKGQDRLRTTGHHLHVVGEQAALDNATWAYLMDFKWGLEGYVGTEDPAVRTQLGEVIEQRVALIDERLGEMHRRYAEGSDGARLAIAQELPYHELRAIWRRWAARPLRRGPAATRARERALAAIRTHGLLMTDSGEASTRGDDRIAEAAEAGAVTEYRETRRWLVAALVVLLAGGLAVIVWFGRSVVPAVERERAERRDAEEHAQLHADLTAALDDREAGTVLAAHLERRIPGATVALIGRPEDADALEVRAAVAPADALAARLTGFRARDCLAMRHGAAQETAPGDRLSGCQVCTKRAGATICQPLLAGDDAAGALVVTLDRGVSEPERRHIQESVERAGPVIAKLRDLVEARSRASTDSLTGTPNRRAFQDAAR